ncbi:MAG: hypothetical protein IJ125_04515 [Atopobiaceae bacterium]|nr:hypothetical protein [Atopobiaceae bacterium]
MELLQLYNLIYGLAASGGREEVLFGTCAVRAREAFMHSIASKRGRF